MAPKLSRHTFSFFDPWQGTLHCKKGDQIPQLPILWRTCGPSAAHQHATGQGLKYTVLDSNSSDQKKPLHKMFNNKCFQNAKQLSLANPNHIKDPNGSFGPKRITQPKDNLLLQHPCFKITFIITLWWLEIKLYVVDIVDSLKTNIKQPDMLTVAIPINCRMWFALGCLSRKKGGL